MTTATGYEVLLNGARGAAEFQRGVERAKCEAIAEEYDAADICTALEFADGSRLELNAAELAATEA